MNTLQLSTLHAAIVQHTRAEIKELNYFYIDHVIGMMSSVFNKAKVPRRNPVNHSCVEHFQQVVEDDFWHGVEPDWHSLQQWQFWHTLPQHVYYYTEAELRQRGLFQNSPYSDKSIPFLCYIQQLPS